MATPDLKSAELKLDPDKLYLEEVFTDRRIGTLRRLTPVTKDGKTDTSRGIVYGGEYSISIPSGLSFAPMAGDRIARSSAGTSVRVTSAGTPAGAKNPTQTPKSGSE